MDRFRRRSRGRSVVVGVAMVLALMVPLAVPAGGTLTVSDPLVEGLAGPLGLAVDRHGTVYVSQTFAGKLTAVSKDGTVRDIAMSASPDTSISGVDVDWRGRVLYTEGGATVVDDGPPDFIGFLKKVKPSGNVKTLGDTATHEETTNPDQVNSYGFQGITEKCSAEIAETVEDIPPEAYDGLVDSNSYAVTRVPGLGKVVADAGANAIFVVKRGVVKTLAVLPPVPVPVDAEGATAFGLPDCVVGSTFNFEPVPTDVEYAKDGLIYISSLAGGPEDGSIPIGGVFTLDPWTGELTRIGGGFLGATDLAVSPGGDVFVTELFGNRVSKLNDGVPFPLLELNEPVAIEYSKGHLYITINAFGNGAVVTVEV